LIRVAPKLSNPPPILAGKDYAAPSVFEPENLLREARRQKGHRGGRPPRYEAAAYRLRSWAERGVNRLKQWRAVATRYDKRAACYLATVQFAAIMIWLRP